MKTLNVLMFLLLSSCGTVYLEDVDPICGPSFQRDLDQHNEALLEDGGPQSKITGVVVLDKLDARCS